MFDSVDAYVMLTFRIAAFGLFVYGVMRSLVRLPADEGKLRQYFYHLVVVGSLYLGFVPVGCMLVEFVEAEERQKVLLMWIELGRLVLNCWLGYLAGSRVSSYRQVINGSFMDKE